jgi:esterase
MVIALGHDVENTTGETTVVFLHGIMGSRGNWKSFARRLVAARPDVCAIVVDLRHHGDSHGPSNNNTVSACAEDVHALIASLQRRADVWIGHSFGGKVATIAALEPRFSPHGAALWSLDSPPGSRSFRGDSEVEKVIAAVRSVPMPATDRRDVVAWLQQQGLSMSLCQWMTTNLRRDDQDGLLHWKMNLVAIEELLHSFGDTDAWPLIDDRNDGSVWMVRGGRSDRWRDDERHHIERSVARGLIRDHVIPNAGHWLHTDDPDALLQHLLDHNLGLP